ncbi:MAG: penicillin-binding transpeptidase domain-containing protein [bacterium]|nr:penicillin-binding transpeptidase domain-containing protein [bacterium]
MRNKKGRDAEIAPDEIFLDSSNLPQFNKAQFEGRLEKPISRHSIFIAGVFFLCVALIFSGRVWLLQIPQGEAYARKGENNRLRHTPLFSERGIMYDRNGKILVSNVVDDKNSEFLLRKYASEDGFAHILGYIKYPSKDAYGFYYNEVFESKAGVERLYDEKLAGENGLKIIEIDAVGRIESESVLTSKNSGQSLTLSVDFDLQAALYSYIKNLSEEVKFEGGAGVIMDVRNGEILAMTSFPEYDSQVLTDGNDTEAIADYVTGSKKPFLNRVTDGLYTPGSIVKPFLALAALNEKIISPSKQILSTGSITIPNPYDTTRNSVFTDWKAHGLVDMRKAIAVSSNVYFYEIGGGFEGQEGLGIGRIEKYAKMFGLGEPVMSGSWFWGKSGVIPNPQWKERNFSDGTWRVGDTYNTAIGQYGFQVTPMQVVRGVAAIANDGKLLEPVFIKGEPPKVARYIEIADSHFEVVKEGMREGVLVGTASGLNLPFVKVAAKTGTAELGASKQFVNSWAVGFFPYDNPKYAFAVIMERGPRQNTFGGVYVVNQLLQWMSDNRREYLQ